MAVHNIWEGIIVSPNAIHTHSSTQITCRQAVNFMNKQSPPWQQRNINCDHAKQPESNVQNKIETFYCLRTTTAQEIFRL